MDITLNKKFIIFDLDGTLINSVPDLRNALNHTLVQKKYRELDTEEVSAMIGNGVKKLIERALTKVKNLEPTEQEVQETMDMYYTYYKNHVCVDTYLYPHVQETLAYLDKKGYDMVICTNKPFEFVEPILEKLQIKSYFKTWIGEDSLEVKKPDAGPLNYLMEQYNHSKEESIMIGDSKNDILAAKNAKIDSIGLSYGYNYDEKIEDYKPTMVISDFAELKQIFA